MARTSSAMDAPFHPDIGFLAQCGRGLLRYPYQAEAHAWRLSLRRRPTSRDQPFPRGAQSPIQTLHLDRRSRQNHRRRQTRVPSVRFDPLDRDNQAKTGIYLRIANAVPDIAGVPASTNNCISNTPSWPKKRTAFSASSKLREGLRKAYVMIGTRV
jgi:hypothetical protein